MPSTMSARIFPFFLMLAAAISFSQIFVSQMLKLSVFLAHQSTLPTEYFESPQLRTNKSPCNNAPTTAITPPITNQNARSPNPPLLLDIPLPGTMPELLIHLRTTRQLQGRKATFVQIGANDGKLYDQLYPVTKQNKTAWIGLLVEPQPILYSKLILLHADAAPAWSFYQGVVIDSCDPSAGVVTFCETKTPGEGNFKTQGQLNGVRSKCDAQTMIQTSRPCVRDYATLLEHGSREFHQATNRGDDTYWVDVLQIDTEGKDYDLIQLIDSSVLHFTCINFEHTYMGDPAVRPQYNQTIAHLRSLMGKMEYIRHAGDTLACRVA